jgi:hypothetical protein
LSGLDMARPQRFCIFCGRPGLTHEHVWPDWLKQYIPKDMTDYTALTATIHPTHSELRRKKQPGDIRSRRLRIVCKECNNGWMSRLQENAKPSLLHLVQGEVTAFDVPTQSLLSSSVAMFVMVAEYFDPYKVTTSQEQRTYLFENGRAPSSNWRIWIGDYQRSKWVGHLAHFAVPISSPEYVPEIMDNGLPRPNTQTMTFVVGRLYVHVASSMTDIFENWRLYRTDLLAQIWPIQRNIIGWPLKAMTDRDADNIAAAFHRFSNEIGRQMTEEGWSKS